MSKKFRAGARRHKISFFTIEKTKNAVSETVENYVFVKTISAAIMQTKIHEQDVADGMEYNSTKTFRVLYKNWITSDHIIEFKGTKYEIKSIENPEELNQDLLISVDTI
ncbi:phage head closure protein [Colwellia sp. E150_009]|jgi:SPP1 family predicted phage head-tail adaptor